MTIVLVIVIVVSSITIIDLKSSYDATKRNQFLYQLQQDLYYAQQNAISRQLSTTVIFLNGSKQYLIRQGGEMILTRNFEQPNTIFVQGTLSLDDISFFPDGNARKSGTLLIRIGEYRYRLVLLLGRGRFYLEQF